MYRAVANPIAGPAFLTGLFHGMDGTGVGGLIAYMRTLPISDIMAALMCDLGIANDERPDGPPSRADAGPLPASGKGMTLEGGLGGSHGEFIERYAGTRAYLRARRDGEIVLAKASEMRRRGRILGPDSLHFFAMEQYESVGFPFSPFTEESRIGWVQGHDASGEPIWIPAVLVFLGYREEPGEERIGYPTTGGLCYGRSEDEATKTAIMEIVERDAINLFWTSGVAPQRVGMWDTGRLSVVRDGSHLLLWQPQTDVTGVHVVHAQYFDFSSSVFLAGGGVDSDLGIAVSKALLEVKQCAHATEYLRHTHFYVELEEVMDFFDVIPYYSEPSRMAELFGEMEDLAGRTETVRAAASSPTADGGESDVGLEPLLDAVGPVYFYRIGVESLGLSGVVLRAVVPGMTLAGVPRLQFLGHERYYTGIVGREFDPPLDYAALNQRVLPFP